MNKKSKLEIRLLHIFLICPGMFYQKTYQVFKHYVADKQNHISRRNVNLLPL